MKTFIDVIRERRSVRTFDGRRIREEDLAIIEEICSKSINPFGKKIEYAVLDSSENGLGSSVITGETAYLAGKLKKEKDSEIAFGLSFEDVLLRLEQIGISGTIMAGFDEKRFRTAFPVEDDEKMPCISPIGYRAESMSVRETVMRKAVGADRRLPVDRICFIDSFRHPASVDELGELGELIELVRLAPSAVNRQPWRMIIKNDTVHFYEKHSRGMQRRDGWDIQKIDMGIALCHFYHGAREKEVAADCIINDPHIIISEDMEYIASMKLV